MILMRFSYDLIYIRIKEIVTADILSHTPNSSPTNQDMVSESEINSFVNSIITNISISNQFL